MLKQIINKLFYNPYKFAAKFINIQYDESAILLKSCSFRFDGIEKNNPVRIGKNSMLGCSIIFESDNGTVEIGDNTFINGGTNIISKENRH